jgi:hypothetical protein
MYRTSTRQAELDARVLRERRIGQRLIDPPDSYTALGRRPGRALLGGLVVSLFVAMVVAVVSVAGAARAAKQRQDQANNASATTVVTETTVPATTALTGDGEIPTSISVGPEAAACEASQEEIAIVPLFTQEGLLERIELAGLPPGCVGREILLSVLGLDGVELASRELVAERAESLSVGDWSQEQQPVRREEIGEIRVEIL